MNIQKPLKPLKSAPVTFVLCKIACGDLLNFDSEHLGSVQDAYRQEGYPHYGKVSSSEIEVVRQPSVLVRQHERLIHHFISNDFNDGVAVSGGDLFVYTNNYINFESYIKKVLNAHRIFSATVNMQTIAGIGIRYIDFINPKQGKSLPDYLNPAILSPEYKGDLSSIEPLNSSMQHTYQTELGSVLVLRSLAGRGLKIVPDDLVSMISPMLVKAATESTLDNTSGISALIDTDHFVQFKALENVKELNLRELIDRLHEYTSNLFFENVTSAAIKEWS